MQRVALGVSGTVCILSLVVIAGAAAQSSRPSDAPSKIELLRYLREHPETPEKYVVGKFTQYDVVFMGELHRIRHDVQLVHRLIPELYRAGVRHLGIEFGNYEDQDLVDQLITADRYDEGLARKLMFRYFVWWGYREYQDIYRKAWEFNRALPATAPKFRVVNLHYRIRWDLLQPEMTPERRRRPRRSTSWLATVVGSSASR